MHRQTTPVESPAAATPTSQPPPNWSSWQCRTPVTLRCCPPWPESWSERSWSTASIRSALTITDPFRCESRLVPQPRAQQLLPDSTVIAAFHHVSAVLLDDPTVD